MYLIKPDISPELKGMPGYAAAKFAHAAPILRSLHRNRIVYRERFIVLVELHEFQFDEWRISGAVKPVHILFLPHYAKLEKVMKGWNFSGSWEYTMLSYTESGYLSIAAPYYGWTIWPEAELAQKTGDFAEKGDMKSAVKLLDPTFFD